MRITRVKRADGSVAAARIEEGHAVPVAEERAAFMADAVRDLIASGGDLAATGPAIPLPEVELLSPLAAPQKIICIGLNYADHIRETGLDTPQRPLAFVKTAHTLAGPYADVVVAAGTTAQLDWEAELAVVIGRTARDVPVERALEHVFGYTAANDLSARDAQFADGQWFRGKNYDGFCPLGPWIVTPDELADPQALAVTARVNGRTLQDGSTKDMIFGVAEVIAYLSGYMTLFPGDVIATGTPHGVGMGRTPQLWLGDGDVVEVEVEGIGTLRNTVRFA
ncbi:MAG: fumarylacetoacetate hydrolase family protein [Nonomuraea sp.]|nr:fumarylacetoacetate hydrolase family protein [Nonomuraea sp.]NUP64558.1 fumarylacetoacetate hydrolase family protein [Nonomuraea sp.]NUP82249.1 fumarylacetoacetate hydrolase family protein [Nonomuraea sp.]NUS01804.1 fumarylacetoacetate hydrolase family protein [Nonomuraea sp.]